ncbi:MAG: SDR family oxidoreductase [Pleurocapsa minor GSE-CHR-MK-17-07R]|nr:SDR family oxidoreductase [Pleurocapsa minor GSE-CHR-MK 17-07R]
MRMKTDLSGKVALLAGPRDHNLEGAGAALMAEGAGIVLAETLEEVRYAVERQPRIDIAVVNAGWRKAGDFLALTNDDWADALYANFEVPVFMMQAIARKMIAGKQGGRIIVLAGIEGMLPFSGQSATGTSLTMIWSIARMAAIDLAPHGITVNIVAPGWTNQSAFSALPGETQAHILAGIPAGRAGSGQDVGAAVLMFATPAAGYLTGVILPVDGGYVLSRSDGRSMLER